MEGLWKIVTASLHVPVKSGQGSAAERLTMGPFRDGFLWAEDQRLARLKMLSQRTLSFPGKPPRDLAERDEKAVWLADKGDKAQPCVERGSLLVLRVHDQGINRRLRAQGPCRGIDDKKGAQALSLIMALNRQTPDQAGRKRWVARQTPGKAVRQLAKGDAGCREGVVPSNPLIGVECHKAIGHMAPDILRHTLPEVSVKRVHAAGKGGAVMVCEKLDMKSFSSHERYRNRSR